MIEQIKKDLSNNKMVFLLEIKENTFTEFITIPFSIVNNERFKILYEEDVERLYINN